MVCSLNTWWDDKEREKVGSLYAALKFLSGQLHFALR